ncbi:acetyltransferase (GNAT) family protein [Collimonas sp. PA-H2]|uniref:GNAT family N-acetyltransferase n=1 Tax=Collimonas sp. PA-H2 TaxID=1881062 RepID=UPI000BF4A88D|nr:GNAT family N-acetyltransferase [Collimonas sp. PA-H2]PFH04438.1 acetyltransferase (GNAT) family protein [Collimonas sp. PA-H2]
MSNTLVSPVRPMLAGDISAVMRIQAECYPPSMLEAEDVFRARLALTPATCWIWSPAPDNAAAYLFSYPSRKDAITPLGAQFKLAAAPDCLYLHDLAVAPDARGQRAANALVAAALDHARAENLEWSALVSVQQSQEFWGRLGYAAIEVEHSPVKENLDSYRVSGSTQAAIYMLRELT